MWNSHVFKFPSSRYVNLRHKYLVSSALFSNNVPQGNTTNFKLKHTRSAVLVLASTRHSQTRTISPSNIIDKHKKFSYYADVTKAYENHCR